MKRRYSIPLALLASLFIYAFFRSEKTVVNELITSIIPVDSYLTLRQAVVDLLPLHDFTIFSLPGGLWVFCVTSLACDFYIVILRYKIQLYPLPLLFSMGLEFCQLVGITKGKFDPWDLICYFAFWMLGYFSYAFRHSQQNILSPFTIRGFTCVVCFVAVYLAHVNI